jgi:hypothetical protein
LEEISNGLEKTSNGLEEMFRGLKKTSKRFKGRFILKGILCVVL